MIHEPGIFYDMSTSEYFSDPCPSPSLTQSLAKLLNERSPLHAWHAHPRLNPNFEPNEETKFDVGNIAHKLMLGRGKQIAVLEGFDDWRTKAAKEARTAALRVGQLAVLRKHYDRADAMVICAREQLAHRGLGHFFRDGNGEVVLAWMQHGLWLRQMVDWLAGDTVIDFKTTDMSVAPHGLGRMMASAGWDVQAAMAERGLNAFTKPARHFIFVVQETQEPYCLSVAELPEEAMVMGRKKLNHAMTIWNHCINNNQWPGYPLEIVKPQYPGWAEQQWLDREVHEAAAERMPQKIDPNILMAG